MAIFNSKLLVYQRVIVPIIFLITIFHIIFPHYFPPYVPIICSHHMIPKGHTPSPWSLKLPHPSTPTKEPLGEGLSRTSWVMA